MQTVKRQTAASQREQAARRRGTKPDLFSREVLRKPGFSAGIRRIAVHSTTSSRCGAVSLCHSNIRYRCLSWVDAVEKVPNCVTAEFPPKDETRDDCTSLCPQASRRSHRRVHRF